MQAGKDDANLYKAMLDRAQQADAASSKMTFSAEETERFKAAFDDPEFRKLFADYMDELQDPANRAETEQYISQV
jgi:dynein assembly factor 2